jgi:hypothetical protein
VDFKAPRLVVSAEPFSPPISINILPGIMPPPHILGTYLAYAFGSFCILSAAPFIGIPFRSSRASAYYASKNNRLSDLTGKRISPGQAGYFGAASRIVLGFGLINARFRKPTCAVMGVVIGYGTYLAVRDSRPFMPQCGMLVAIGAVVVLA